MEAFRLSNGVEIPAVGFGTYKAAEDGQTAVIREALAQGYRHLDTASFYGNEEQVGEALRQSGLPRESVFLTTKVWKTELGQEEAKAAAARSCERLGVDYLDLLLIHWPKATPDAADWEELCARTWQGMEELYRAGKVRAIGVSNFLPHHLMVLSRTADIAPMVDQLEFHPGYAQTAAVEYCQKQGIVVEAWSPLGRTRVLQEPVITEMASRYGRSPAQICLRFALDCGVLPLPKASSAERMRQNMDIFDFKLSEMDLQILKTLPPLGWSGEHPDRERIRF